METDKKFNAYFKTENLKIIGDDYDVEISQQKISHFINRNKPVKYWIALEPDSEFFKEFLNADFLWVEQYRPKTIQIVFYQIRQKKTFLEFLKKKEIPNMLLSGTAGTGKTTVARALCDELNADYIIINAPMKVGI